MKIQAPPEGLPFESRLEVTEQFRAAVDAGEDMAPIIRSLRKSGVDMAYTVEAVEALGSIGKHLTHTALFDATNAVSSSQELLVYPENEQVVRTVKSRSALWEAHQHPGSTIIAAGGPNQLLSATYAAKETGKNAFLYGRADQLTSSDETAEWFRLIDPAVKILPFTDDTRRLALDDPTTVFAVEGNADDVARAKGQVVEELKDLEEVIDLNSPSGFLKRLSGLSSFIIDMVAGKQLDRKISRLYLPNTRSGLLAHSLFVAKEIIGPSLEVVGVQQDNLQADTSSYAYQLSYGHFRPLSVAEGQVRHTMRLMYEFFGVKLDFIGALAITGARLEEFDDGLAVALASSGNVTSNEFDALVYPV